MKNLILILLVLFIQLTSFAQDNQSLRKFKEFELGMSEDDFIKIIEGKYQYEASYAPGMVKTSSKIKLDAEYKLEIKGYYLRNFFARIGDVGFDVARFYFVEGVLYKIYIGIKEPISVKDAKTVGDFLYKNYHKCKYFGKRLPNTKSEIDREKYTGNWYFKDLVSAADRTNEGLQVYFKYYTKRNYDDISYFSLTDFTIKKPWEAVVKLRQEAVSQNLKPYDRFRKAFLGMQFSKFKKLYPNIEKVENPIKDEDLIIYENCDVYINKEEKMELIGVPLQVVWYFFYKNQLLAIGVKFNSSEFKERYKDRFLKDIQIVYGKYTKIKDKSYNWVNAGEHHNIQAGLLNNDMLFYANEYLGEFLFEEAKEKKKTELQNDF